MHIVHFFNTTRSCSKYHSEQRDSTKAFVFRNYGHFPGINSLFGGCQYKMWQAIRASSAAPGYFAEYALGNDLHQVSWLCGLSSKTLHEWKRVGTYNWTQRDAPRKLPHVSTWQKMCVQYRIFLAVCFLKLTSLLVWGAYFRKDCIFWNEIHDHYDHFNLMEKCIMCA